MALKSYTVDWGELHRLPDRVDGALYARTTRHTRLFQVWPAATFFLRTKKEGKDVPGESPPGPPGGLPAIFRGKPAVARLPESTIKKGCGPGAWGWLHFFGPAPTPTPGASGPPCCMDVGSRKNGNAGFSKRKPANFPEPFCPLLRLWAKVGGRAFDIFIIASRSFCADKPTSRFCSYYALVP